MRLISSRRASRAGLAASLVTGALLSVPITQGSAYAGNFPSTAKAPHENQRKSQHRGSGTSSPDVVIEMEDFAWRAFRNKPVGTKEQVTSWRDAFDRVSDMRADEVVHISGTPVSGQKIFMQSRRTKLGDFRYYLMTNAPRGGSPAVGKGSFDSPEAEAAEAEKSFPVASLSIKLLQKVDGGRYQTVSGNVAFLV
jgi:hypothetical protein